MIRALLGAVRRTVRGIGRAIGARPGAFAAVALGVFALNIFLPPVVLSVTRKPWDFFMLNPWLKKLPEYLASSAVPIGRKIEFLPNLAVFWFSADGPYGSVEWGYAVMLADLARFVFMSLLFGAYFALWSFRRHRLAPVAWGAGAGRHGGSLGAVVSALGFTTGPCTVTGCGAPVIPVLGLAFVGLSSGTLSFLAELSRVATLLVLVGVTLGVGYFGWLAGATAGGERRSAPTVVHCSPHKEGVS